MTSPGSSRAEGLGGAILRLVRFPLVPTAVADSAAGYLIVGGSDPAMLSVLAATSAFLYMAGMVLNDVSDRERDILLHPERPIPAGRIRLPYAVGLFILLVGAGLSAAWKAGEITFLAAIALAVAIVAYDDLLKAWRIAGSLGMGACRALNMSLGIVAGLPIQYLLPCDLFPRAVPGPFIPALLLGGYVTIVTLISTMEEKRPEAAKWVAILLRGIIPLDAAMVALSGRPLAALGILGLLPLALLLKRLLPRHE